MKRGPVITVLLIAIAAQLAAAGALCGAVVRVAADPNFYARDSRLAVAQELGLDVGEDGLSEADEAAVTNYVGLTREEQEEFAWRFALNVRLPGATFADFDILQAHEQQHMRDVRDLIVLAEKAAKGCTTLAAILVIVAAWTGAWLARRLRTGLLGVACGGGVLALIAGGAVLAMNTVGFERLFILMHEMLFTNRYWLLNPSTDMLIRMMPQPLFETALSRVLAQAGASFAGVALALAAVYGIVGGMIRRNMAEEK